MSVMSINWTWSSVNCGSAHAAI